MLEFKKMAVPACFTETLFSCELPSVGKGYTTIQVHHRHGNLTINDVLYELATSYKLMNAICGLIPLSLFVVHVKVRIMMTLMMN